MSYAHESERHKRLVRDFCDFLSDQGDLDVVADVFVPDVRINWASWAEEQILLADFVVVVASPVYHQVASPVSPPLVDHRGVRYEIGLLKDRLTDDDAWVRRILPVVLPGGKVEEIPGFLLPRVNTHYLVSRPFSRGADDLLAALRYRHGEPSTARRPLSPPALKEHWWPAVRGSSTSTTEWYFTGRDRAMSKVAEFTRTKEQGLCVVTGMPGVGKSALLAAVVLRSLRPSDLPGELRAGVPDCGVDAALFASGKNVGELVSGLADALGAPRPDPGNAVETLMYWLEQQQPRRYTVVIDAIDEAKTAPTGPDDPPSGRFELMGLLSNLAQRVRLVIGVRREPQRTDDPLMAVPPPLRRLWPHVVDLDDTEKYLTATDVARYIARLLRADPRPNGYGRGGGWDDEELLDVVGRESTRKARGNFLIAQFIAEELLAMPPIQVMVRGWSASLHWPDRLEDWLEHDVERRLRGSDPWIKELLEPIAMAERGGLPDDLWLAVASAFQKPREVTERDLEQALRILGFFLDQTGGAAPAYSMRHESFVRYFTGRWRERRDRIFFETLLDRVPVVDGVRQWHRARDYARANLLTHARNAGQIESLITEEPRCLAAADPDSAVAPLTGLADPQARQVVRVYRRAAYAQDGTFPERVAALQFHAGLLGAVTVAHALAAAEPPLPWITPWRAGGPPSAIPLGGADLSWWVLPVDGPHDAPAALLVRPDGRGLLVDAATQAPLGPTFTIRPPGTEPPDAVTAWTEPSRDVRIAVAASDGTITIWTAAGQGASTHPTGSVRPAHPPNRLLVIGGPRGLKLMCLIRDADPGLSVRPLNETAAPLETPGAGVDFVAPLAATAATGAVLTGTRTGVVRLWRFRSNALPEVHTEHVGGELRGLRSAGTAESACVVADVDDGRRVFWIGATGSLIDEGLRLGAAGQVSAMALTGSGDGALVATAASYGTITIRSLRPGHPPREIATIDLGGPIKKLVFLDEAGTLIAGVGWSGTVQVFTVGGAVESRLVTRLQSGEQVAQLLGLGTGEDGPLLATRGLSGLTKFWQVDVAGGAEDGADAPAVRDVVCAGVDDGRGLVVASADGHDEAWVWHADRAASTAHPIVLAHGEPVEQIAAAATGHGSALVCAAGDERLTLWSLGAAGHVGTPRTWPTDENLVEHLAVVATPALRLVCAAGPEFLRIWDARGEELFALPDVPVTCLSRLPAPDGGVSVVAGTDDVVHLVSVGPTGEIDHRVLDHAEDGEQVERVEEVAVAPVTMGRRLLSAVGDLGRVVVWDLDGADGPERVTALPLNVPGVRTAWVSAAGRPVLVTVGAAGPIRFWDVLGPHGPRPVREVPGPGGRVSHLVVAESAAGTASTAGTVACAFSSGTVVFVRPDRSPAVTARLNCDLAGMAFLPGPDWFVGAHGSALVALRPGQALP
ncbi:nSTAND1 domain-containing NTPase [Streptosporangium sp. H16]|uniref:nSTAND1 domain-containing NTPase n=1 Tax=Streptosporangium sp. H16 TaxID=3444184 RepID=UPI003F796DC8